MVLATSWCCEGALYLLRGSMPFSGSTAARQPPVRCVFLARLLVLSDTTPGKRLFVRTASRQSELSHPGWDSSAGSSIGACCTCVRGLSACFHVHYSCWQRRYHRYFCLSCVGLLRDHSDVVCSQGVHGFCCLRRKHNTQFVAQTGFQRAVLRSPTRTSASDWFLDFFTASLK